MHLGIQHHKLRSSLLALGLTPLAMALAAPLQAQVVWEPVTEQQAQQDEILLPIPGGSSTKPEPPQAIVWEPVPSTESRAEEDTSTIVWTPVPESKSMAGGSTPTTTVMWEVIPDSDTRHSPAPASNLAEAGGDSSAIKQESPPPEVIAQEAEMPPRMVPDPPPPPPIQALNRSIAYGDGLVGPDIGWNVPSGFRWSQRWFADASVRGFSRRPNDSEFFAWNNGDANAQIHANVLQTKHWSIGLNTSFRSVYQGDDAAGGSTQVGEGVSSGFRISRAIGDTGGIALGGEQILQWDEFTDTGRNFYLMTSKGWWLGSEGKDFPLIIANGGLGTTKFAQNENLQLGCIDGVQNRTGTFAVDNDLCIGPIGSLAVVWNEWWGVFLEYNSKESILGTSLNLTGGIPMRMTWGVTFARDDEIIPSDEWNWVFRASIGF